MPGQWGLQKRIMAYVAVGLLLTFALFFFVGMRAMGRSTEFILDERLAIAASVAAELADEVDHVIPDTEEQFAQYSQDGEPMSSTHAARTLRHFNEVDRFSFFDVVSLWLIDASGSLVAEAPEGSHASTNSPDLASVASVAVAQVIWPEHSAGDDSRLFFSAVVPLRNRAGEIWAHAVVNTEGRDARGPFVPIGFREAGDVDERAPPISQYHLELVARSGSVVLGIGPDEYVGEQSPHFAVIRDWFSTRTFHAQLHTTEEANEGRTHIMAAVPVDAYPVYLILEQDRDVALAVAKDFRTQLLLFSGIGLVVALAVAWVTTRRVVRPTELLAAAAERMAGGDLATPIEVTAQDEVAVLAQNLEAMRTQHERALNDVKAANEALESRVRERTQELQGLVRRVFTAQEEERHRVALELHDETAQALTAVKLAIDTIAVNGGSLTPEDAQTLDDARRMSRVTLESVRRLVQSLGPAALEHMGVAAALRSYADEFLKSLRVNVRGSQARFPEQIELALYRIGQEALNNVRRHAQASAAVVSLTHDDTSVVLTVTDDGVGFDPRIADGSASGRGGLGIAGMRERAHLVGGEFSIRSAEGQGTTVTVEIPIPHDG